MNRREFLTGLGAALLLPRETFAYSEPFPDIQARDINANPQDLKSKYLGKKTILNFWYAACDACIKEIPFLNELHAKINIISIAIITSSTAEDIGREIQAIADQHQRMTHPHFLATNSDWQTIENFYRKQHPEFKGGYLGFPTFFLLDSKGNCTYSSVGALLYTDGRPHQNYSNLEAAITKLK